MAEQPTVKQNLASSIETIDGAFLDYVEGMNIFCTTINGSEKVPVIWSSAERSYQIKNNKELRDSNGTLIPPIISIERISTVKDVKNKGPFQSNLSPRQDRYVYSKEINQDKTSNFANADTLKTRGQVNFVTSKKNQKIVYTHVSVPIPVYITVEYKINIITNYQAQMNEAIQPFMSRISQNYFLINKDGYRYESFMDQSFEQESIDKLGEEERKYKSSIKVKVLGYLIGEGPNQEKPQTIDQENAVELKIPKESLAIVQEEPRKQKYIPSLLRNAGTQESSAIAINRTYLIGNGIDSVYSVTHNLSTRDMYIGIRETASPYASIIASVTYTDVNTLSIDMGTIIATDSYTVTVIG